ncbi:MAG TPA: hypothetical protein VGA95_07575 [Thermodesulfobacteriota bacterium]
MKIITLIREKIVTNISNIIAFALGFTVAWLILVLLKLDNVAIVGLLGVIIGAMVTSFSNYLISERQRKEKLELIAYDKIVDAHQKAYAHWYKVTSKIYDNRDELNKAYFEMQDWLSENCLYLDPEIEDALRVSIDCASHHEGYVNTKSDSKFIMENWNDIHKPRTLIRTKIKLHPIPIPEDPKGRHS